MNRTGVRNSASPFFRRTPRTAALRPRGDGRPGQGVASGGRGASTSLAHGSGLHYPCGLVRGMAPAQWQPRSTKRTTRDPVPGPPCYAVSSTESLGGTIATRASQRAARRWAVSPRCERSDRASETPGRPPQGGRDVPPGGLIQIIPNGWSCRLSGTALGPCRRADSWNARHIMGRGPAARSPPGGKDSRARGASAAAGQGKVGGRPCPELREVGSR